MYKHHRILYWCFIRLCNIIQSPLIKCKEKKFLFPGGELCQIVEQTPRCLLLLLSKIISSHTRVFLYEIESNTPRNWWLIFANIFIEWKQREETRIDRISLERKVRCHDRMIDMHAQALILVSACLKSRSHFRSRVQWHMSGVWSHKFDYHQHHNHALYAYLHVNTCVITFFV